MKTVNNYEKCITLQFLFTLIYTKATNIKSDDQYVNRGHIDGKGRLWTTLQVTHKVVEEARSHDLLIAEDWLKSKGNICTSCA